MLNILPYVTQQAIVVFPVGERQEWAAIIVNMANIKCYRKQLGRLTGVDKKLQKDAPRKTSRGESVYCRFHRLQTKRIRTP